jgi:hypothetical protein
MIEKREEESDGCNGDDQTRLSRETAAMPGTAFSETLCSGMRESLE